MPTVDVYLLGRSPSFSLTAVQEQRVNLSLQPNTEPISGRVRGTVTDSEGTPVDEAIVKLLTSMGVPFAHVHTNPAGNYIFTDVPPGDYQITAIKSGFLLAPTQSFTLLSGQTVVMDITLTPDTSVNRNVIFGLVTNAVTGAPIADADVGLGVPFAPVGGTKTNSVGQFILYAVPDGTFQIAASAAGFTTLLKTIMVSGGVIAQTNFPLSPSSAAEATVNGLILSNTGVPLANACVGLYSLTDSIENLLQVTFSDSRGFYLFGHIAAGTYVVKAKVEGVGEIHVPPVVEVA